MHPRDGDPLVMAEAGVDVAADRRRQGRREANPQLLPLLRGQFDPRLSADLAAGRPGRLSVDRQLLSGAIITGALLLVGVMLRFMV